jgi:hypothetical protein
MKGDPDVPTRELLQLLQVSTSPQLSNIITFLRRSAAMPRSKKIRIHPARWYQKHLALIHVHTERHPARPVGGEPTPLPLSLDPEDYSDLICAVNNTRHWMNDQDLLVDLTDRCLSLTVPGRDDGSFATMIVQDVFEFLYTRVLSTPPTTQFRTGDCEDHFDRYVLAHSSSCFCCDTPFSVHHYIPKSASNVECRTDRGTFSLTHSLYGTVLWCAMGVIWFQSQSETDKWWPGLAVIYRDSSRAGFAEEIGYLLSLAQLTFKVLGPEVNECEPVIVTTRQHKAYMLSAKIDREYVEKLATSRLDLRLDLKGIDVNIRGAWNLEENITLFVEDALYFLERFSRFQGQGGVLVE